MILEISLNCWFFDNCSWDKFAGCFSYESDLKVEMTVQIQSKQKTAQNLPVVQTEKGWRLIMSLTWQEKCMRLID